jgi:hypothetical protein
LENLKYPGLDVETTFTGNMLIDQGSLHEHRIVDITEGIPITLTNSLNVSVGE